MTGGEQALEDPDTGHRGQRLLAGGGQVRLDEVAVGASLRRGTHTALVPERPLDGDGAALRRPVAQGTGVRGLEPVGHRVVTAAEVAQGRGAGGEVADELR